MFDKEQNKTALINAKLLKLLTSRLVAPPARVFFYLWSKLALCPQRSVT